MPHPHDLGSELSARILRAQAWLGYVLSDGTRIVEANDAACSITGYTREELMALPSALAVLPEEVRPQLETTLRENAASGRAWTSRVPFIRKDGSRAFVEVGACASMDPAGRPEVLAVFRDITTEAPGPEAVAARFALLDALDDWLRDPAWLFEATPEGPLTLVATNAAARRLGDPTAAEPSLASAFGAEQARVIEEHVLETGLGGGAKSFLQVARATSPSSVLEMTTALLRDGKRVLLVGSDVATLADRSARRRADALSRPLVHDAIRELLRIAALGPPRRRAFGEALVALIAPQKLDAALLAFAQIGLGRLALASHNDGTYVFHGDELVETVPGLRSVTCDAAVGFLVGALRNATGRDTVGAEVQCVSKGDPACRFELRVR